METRDMLRQRVLEARCAEAIEACYVYEIQDDPDQPIGGHDAVLDLTAAKELESQSDTIAHLEAELERVRGERDGLMQEKQLSLRKLSVLTREAALSARQLGEGVGDG